MDGSKQQRTAAKLDHARGEAADERVRALGGQETHDDWKAIAEDREREANLARTNEARSAERASKAVAELDALPVVMRVIQIFVDTMEGQKACCACMERLTMDSPQQGHMEGCTYAALVELVETRDRMGAPNP